MSVADFTQAEFEAAVQAAVRKSPLSIVVRQLQGRYRWGTGSPEGVVGAPRGTLWEREDGTAGTMLYQKQSGTGDTGWVAIA